MGFTTESTVGTRLAAVAIVVALSIAAAQAMTQTNGVSRGATCPGGICLPGGDVPTQPAAPACPDSRPNGPIKDVWHDVGVGHGVVPRRLQPVRGEPVRNACRVAARRLRAIRYVRDVGDIGDVDITETSTDSGRRQ